MLPRLAVWRVLHKDKVLSPWPHLVMRGSGRLFHTLCTPAGFTLEQSPSSGGSWLPCPSGQAQAKGCLSAGPYAEGKAQTGAADGAGAGSYVAKSPPGSGSRQEESWQDANLHPCAQLTLAHRCPRSTFSVLVICSEVLLSAVPTRTALSCHTGMTALREGKRDFPQGLLPMLVPPELWFG